MPNMTADIAASQGHASAALYSLGRAMSARQAEIRRDILLTAKHRFARFGFDGTSLADIARSVDLSPAEVLLHFEDKLSILMTVFEEGWASINPRLQDIVITSASARQAALSMLAIMMNILERDEDFARLLLFESRRVHPESGEIMVSKGYRWFIRLCTELVVRGQKDGSFSRDYDPRVIVSILTGGVENLMRDRILAYQDRATAPITGTQCISAFDALVSFIKPSSG